VKSEYSWQAIAHSFEQVIGHMTGPYSYAESPLTLRSGKADW
jgi:hypothetical protein